MTVVVMDASVLINMILIDHLDWFGALEEFEFLVPEEVVAEITNPGHASKLRAAFSEGFLQCVSIVDLDELTDYADLRQTMGKGEAASLAIAHARGAWVACDERRRFLRHARERIGEGRVLNTPGLIVLAIRAGLIDVDEADNLKNALEKQRFKMTFSSFRNLIE